MTDSMIERVERALSNCQFFGCPDHNPECPGGLDCPKNSEKAARAAIKAMLLPALADTDTADRREAVDPELIERVRYAVEHPNAKGFMLAKAGMTRHDFRRILATLTAAPDQNAAEQVLKFVGSLLPVGNPTMPGEKVVAFYIRADELRLAKELIAAATGDA